MALPKRFPIVRATFAVAYLVLVLLCCYLIFLYGFPREGEMPTYSDDWHASVLPFAQGFLISLGFLVRLFDDTVRMSMGPAYEMLTHAGVFATLALLSLVQRRLQ